ncbi:OLC1v1030073C1 [Oldenlandia corymbosa var. corymbosa]|uniref:OLC1v1030073C1 n=1 Tax=Oldenlandia corymbosa var. corymbosa TaxID=529605 RepID=A0AAV1CI74_OLDCO|nr:OLC1v1030073C1 [Oldenlandia corymbosa var. corymbosa]
MPLKENSELLNESSQTLVSHPATSVVATSVAATNKFAILDTIQEEEGKILKDVILEDVMDDTEVSKTSGMKLLVTQEVGSEASQQEGLPPSDLLRQEEETQSLLRLDCDVPLIVGMFHDDAEIGKRTERLDVFNGDHACWSESNADKVHDQETTQGEVSESQKELINQRLR